MILTAGPSITELEEKYVLDAVKNGWNNEWNKYIQAFEQEFAEYIGTKYALSTSSCTGAMHLSLLALGIGPGDEVIVPDTTWVATASSVVYTGATPVFCDVEEDGWCMDLNSMQQLINKKTKAIFPVHLYGHPANMPEILKIAKANNLLVIEDAAPSVGASIDNKRTGSFGDVACFSFQGAKTLCTGEGGMLVTNNPDIFNRTKHLGDHGRNPKSPLASIEIGYKYKMSNLQAALGLGQLQRVEDLVAKKRSVFNRYKQNLEGCPGIKIAEEHKGRKSAIWMTSIELLGANYDKREKFMQALKSKGVDNRPVFSPLSSLPMFVNNKSTNNAVATRIGQSAINLPSGYNLTDSKIDYVCESIVEICKEKTLINS